MYDPMTVAFEIRYPWRKYRRSTSPFGKNYRAPFITIWHVDPEDRRGMHVQRGDDTCGWFVPPYPPEDHERIKKLGRDRYSTIFNKQWAIAEGKDYARVCYVPSSYDAIYWAWRAIKHAESKRTGWQYGHRLSAKELDRIYELDSNPVDNLRMTVATVKDEETCAAFFVTLYHCYLRFYRPWYRHPRWHVWHWHIQIHPWQTFRRWALSRCRKCGGRFRWGESPMSDGWDSQPLRFMRGEIGVYHSDCTYSGNSGAEVPRHQGSA